MNNNNNFILNSMLKSLKYGSRENKLQPNNVFYNTYENIIKDLIDKCHINIVNEKGEIEEKIKIDDWKVIFSYIIYKDNFLYYIYTKDNLRKKDYAKKLLESANFKSTNVNIRFYTDSGYYFLKKLNKNIFYYPIYPVK